MNEEKGVGITINGTLTSAGDTPTWTCLGGSADGPLTISVTYAKMPTAVTPRVTLTAASGMAVMTAVEEQTPPVFVGEGNLVEDVASQATCLTNGAASTSWCGTFEFAQVEPDAHGG